MQFFWFASRIKNLGLFWTKILYLTVTFLHQIWLDLARGPYFAHPCFILNKIINYGPELFFLTL